MADDLASARYRLLVQAFGEVREHAYGWKAEAARTLGVSASYISRVASGRPYKAGRHAIDAAVHRVPGLSREWFESSSAATPDLLGLVSSVIAGDTRAGPVQVETRSTSGGRKTWLVSVPSPLVRRGAREEWERVLAMSLDVLAAAEGGELPYGAEERARALLSAIRDLTLTRRTDDLERELRSGRRTRAENAMWKLALHARMIAAAVLTAPAPDDEPAAES